MRVRITKTCPPFVHVGEVHPRHLDIGTESSDANVVDVALRNGWGEVAGGASAAHSTTSARAPGAPVGTRRREESAGDALAAAQAAAAASAAKDSRDGASEDKKPEGDPASDAQVGIGKRDEDAPPKPVRASRARGAAPENKTSH